MDRSRLCTATFSQGPTLTATTAGAGNGTVGALGIACPGDCIESYPSGTYVVLEATLPSVVWSGDCAVIDGAFCIVGSMDSDKTVTADFGE